MTLHVITQNSNSEEIELKRALANSLFQRVRPQMDGRGANGLGGSPEGVS